MSKTMHEYIRMSKIAKQLNKVVENYHEIVSESK